MNLKEEINAWSSGDSFVKNAVPTSMVIRIAESYAKERAIMCLNIAKGCHDYNGGHHDKATNEAFHHGIQTVTNCLEKFNKNGLNDLQLRVIAEIGANATPTGADTKEENNG